MTADKWMIVFLIVFALVAAGVLLNDAVSRYNDEREQTIQAIQDGARMKLTAEWLAGD